MISQNFVKNIGLIIPPSGFNPAIKATSNVETGAPRGFMFVSLDLSFHITGDVHTTLTPTPTIKRQARKKNEY